MCAIALYKDYGGREARETESLLTKVWKLGWGVVFIVVMTVLSECGPHTVYSKIPSAPANPASQPGARCIK